MTTQQDFQGLVTRIGTATDKLEVAVGIVESNAGDANGAAVEAKQAAVEAKASATQAAASATQAAGSAATAKTEADRLIAANVLPEAPKDNKQYARENGAWTEVQSSTATGTVNSVNNKTPDGAGNVTLAAADVGASPSTHGHADATTVKSGFMSPADKQKTDSVETGATKGANWDLNVTNKPTIPSKTSQLTNDSGYVGEAPNDGKQYARVNKTWAEVTASGGGDAPLWPKSDNVATRGERSWEYNFGTAEAPDWKYIRSWPAGMERSISLSFIRREGGAMGGGNLPVTTNGWNEMFSTSGYMSMLPAGTYWFDNTHFKSGQPGPATLNGKWGYIEVKGRQDNNFPKMAIAYVYNDGTMIALDGVYVWVAGTGGNAGTWKKITIA